MKYALALNFMANKDVGIFVIYFFIPRFTHRGASIQQSLWILTYLRV